MKNINKKEFVWLLKAMMIMVVILAIVKMTLNYLIENSSLKQLLNWVALLVVFLSFLAYFTIKKPYKK